MTGKSFEAYIQDVARVPTGLVVLCRNGLQLPDALRLELERILGCPVYMVVDTGDRTENARQLLTSVYPWVQLVTDDVSGDVFIEARAGVLPPALLGLASLFIERPVLYGSGDTPQRRSTPSTKRRGTDVAPLNNTLRDQLGKLMGVGGFPHKTTAVRKRP